MWQTQDELDEDDPTRPFEGDELAVAEVDLDGNPLLVEGSGPTPLFGSDGAVNWERGFADARSALRLWADPEGTLARVRLSPHWRERVGQPETAAGRAGGLQLAFTQVFALLNAVLDDQAEQAEPTPTGELVNGQASAEGPELGWDAYNELTEQIDQVFDQLGGLAPDEGHGRWVGGDASGRGAEGAVVLRLDRRRRYAGVQFDPRWLADSRINDVSRAVLEADRDAHARFTPATYEPGLRDQLDARVTRLRAGLSAMMQRGVER